MPQPTDTSRTRVATQLDEAFYAARSLEPNERLRLIARLWASLPRDHWAAPSDSDLDELERRLNAFDTSGLESTPWKIVRIVAGNYSDPLADKRTVKLYSAPRRFDLFTIMIVTAAYAVLLSGMSALHFSPAISCCVAIFITLVGLSQALFGSANPRTVSIYAGMPSLFVCTMSYFLFDPRISLNEIGGLLPVAIFLSPILGGPLGYLAGVLVGGVFLVADVLRQRYGIETDGALADIELTEIEANPPIHPLDQVPSITH